MTKKELRKALAKLETAAKERKARKKRLKEHFRRSAMEEKQEALRKRRGFPEPEHPTPGTRPKECMVEGCDRPNRTAGYCSAHYMQIHKHGRITHNVIRAHIRKPK